MGYPTGEKTITRHAGGGGEYSMWEELKQEVCRENKRLAEYGLVVLTWGNVSARTPDGEHIIIKPSGVEYASMTPEQMVVTDLLGNIVEGDLRPSSDLATHLEIYRSFPEVGGVVHTHSRFAASLAQAERDLPCYGTTHADYFYGPVPCTRHLTEAEIAGDYEGNTGKVIVETFRSRGIGTRVLEKCRQETDLPNFLYVFVRNVRAIALYQRMGFRIVKAAGETRYIMEQ